jgi:ribosomal protein S18 acetylase RimI-like enzyme
MVIRQATIADAPLIAEFNALMAEETEGKHLETALLLDGVHGLLSDSSRGVYYLTEIDGAVVGQLMVTYEWSDWRNGNFWWIQSVYVKPEFRARGVFTSLYKFIEQLARQRNDVCGIRLYVDETNTRAKKTYEKLGMHPTHYQLYEVDFVLK